MRIPLRLPCPLEHQAVRQLVLQEPHHLRPPHLRRQLLVLLYPRRQGPPPRVPENHLVLSRPRRDPRERPPHHLLQLPVRVHHRDPHRLLQPAPPLQHRRRPRHRPPHPRPRLPAPLDVLAPDLAPPCRHARRARRLPRRAPPPPEQHRRHAPPHQLPAPAISPATSATVSGAAPASSGGNES